MELKWRKTLESGYWKIREDYGSVSVWKYQEKVATVSSVEEGIKLIESGKLNHE